MLRQPTLKTSRLFGLIVNSWLLAVLVVSVSCTGTTSPLAPVREAVYVFVHTPGVSVQPTTAASRYVVRDDGTFTAQFLSWYHHGRYTESDGRVTFAFNTWKVGSATGVLAGDTLEVSYNLDMLMAELENARYVRVP